MLHFFLKASLTYVYLYEWSYSKDASNEKAVRECWENAKNNHMKVNLGGEKYSWQKMIMETLIRVV